MKTKKNKGRKEGNLKLHQKFLQFIQKNRFYITVIMLFLIIVLILFIPLAIYRSFFSLQTLRLSLLIAQIISAFFVIAGVFVGVWQYYISARSFAMNIQRDNIEKAIKLSEYYKDNVIHFHTIINFVFEQAGVLALLKKADLSKMHNFNKIEMKEVFGKGLLDKIEDINSSDELMNSILLANESYGLNLKIQFDTNQAQESMEALTVNANDGMITNAAKSTMIKAKKEDSEARVAAKRKSLIISSFLSDVIATVLNNLEYFAFNFTHKIADESVIYQSISPTYINLVEMLYINISKNNDTHSAVTYYTNVVELYLTWKKKQNEQQKTIDALQNTNVIDKGSRKCQ